MQCDIAVVGGGAAGLMAAIFAARNAPNRRVVVIDGAQKIGAKILIAGGGRCNVTHDVVEPADFNGNRNAIARVLRTFSVEQTIAFFLDLGVKLKREETGKLFPVTDKARTVLDALLRATRDAGTEVTTGTKVLECIATDAGFELTTASGALAANVVILATGGRSVPKTGSDGHGYTIARALGHTVTETFPGLVPLVIDEPHWIRELSGTAADAEVEVRSSSGRVLRRDRGSLLFTHFGLSGPVVLDISRHWIAARRSDPAATLVLNFLPGISLDAMLRDSVAKNPRATFGSALRGRIPERIVDRVAPATPISQMKREQRREIVRTLTNLTVPVSRDRGFDYAEVTAGGVPLSEIDISTMASRIRPNLFLCGEILDVDGRIGGFNFQWAWTTGRLAGVNAARRDFSSPSPRQDQTSR
ncbi:MAG TPA: NAD(P)/FAD-dependent oxidoreductase [Thermoanaerobaculia bacterium]|nr:NAD(P)/FAD-dependent oxidoreductase [Thermoanaerobaculia bacterium]